MDLRGRSGSSWIGLALSVMVTTLSVASAQAQSSSQSSTAQSSGPQSPAPQSSAAQSSAPQSLAPQPWQVAPDVAYVYDANGKTLAYKMGTSNAKDLLKGAKKVPKGTLFFMGANGQLYMRSGPYLEDDGRFKFGPG